MSCFELAHCKQLEKFVAIVKNNVVTVICYSSLFEIILNKIILSSWELASLSQWFKLSPTKMPKHILTRLTEILGVHAKLALTSSLQVSDEPVIRINFIVFHVSSTNFPTLPLSCTHPYAMKALSRCKQVFPAHCWCKPRRITVKMNIGHLYTMGFFLAIILVWWIIFVSSLIAILKLFLKGGGAMFWEFCRQTFSPTSQNNYPIYRFMWPVCRCMSSFC